MTTTPAQTASTSTALTSGQVFDVAIGIGIIAFVVVILPLLLSWVYGNKAPARDTSGRPESFFQIPFITWFIVHYGIAALAILAIVLLGVDNVIDKGTVSALLGSLFGYVLGSASKGSRPSATSTTTDTDAAGKSVTGGC